jgi:hypothetical protein
MATGFDRYAPVLLRAETSWKKLLMTALRKNYPNHHASTPKVALLHRDKSEIARPEQNFRPHCSLCRKFRKN